MSSWKEGDAKKVLMPEWSVWEPGKQKENPGMLVMCNSLGGFLVFRQN